MGNWPLAGKRLVPANSLSLNLLWDSSWGSQHAKSYAGDLGGDTDGTRMPPISLRSSVRRIRRGGGAQVDVQTLGRGASRRVAVSIRVVVCAVRGNVFPPGRLCKLPYLGKTNSAGCRIRRTLRKCASR